MFWGGGLGGGSYMGQHASSTPAGRALSLGGATSGALSARPRLGGGFRGFNPEAKRNEFLTRSTPSEGGGGGDLQRPIDAMLQSESAAALANSREKPMRLKADFAGPRGYAVQDPPLLAATIGEQVTLLGSDGRSNGLSTVRVMRAPDAAASSAAASSALEPVIGQLPTLYLEEVPSLSFPAPDSLTFGAPTV